MQVDELRSAAYGIIDPDYARVFTIARCIAWSEGYALVMHGSFTRDLDLIAVPWDARATDPDHLVKRIALALDDLSILVKSPDAPSQASAKPHGRLAWTLVFKAFGDPRFVDLSVMPREAHEAAKTPTPEPAWDVPGNAAFYKGAILDALDDMGADGLCVSGVAKAALRFVLGPMSNDAEPPEYSYDAAKAVLIEVDEMHDKRSSRRAALSAPASAKAAPESGVPMHEGWRYGEMIYNALYQHQGGLWRAVSDNAKDTVWHAAGYRFASMLAAPSPGETK